MVVADKNKIVEIPYEDDILQIDVSKVKRKQAMRLYKLYKKHKDEPEVLMKELDELGIYVKKVKKPNNKED